MTQYKTRQEIFNQAYIGLAGQGWLQSLDGSFDCVYRSEDGLSCAIGHCISDDKYSEDLEGLYVEDVAVQNAAGISGGDVVWADDLQECHDIMGSPEQMKSRFYLFGALHNLTIPDAPETVPTSAHSDRPKQDWDA